MSIYSGFATRQQQQLYNTYLVALIRNMHRRLLNFYKNQISDQSKFLSNIKKLHHNMNKMEKYKYLQPKFSNLFQEILFFLQQNFQMPGGYSHISKKYNVQKQESIASFKQSQMQPLLFEKRDPNNQKSLKINSPATIFQKINNDFRQKFQEEHRQRLTKQNSYTDHKQNDKTSNKSRNSQPYNRISQTLNLLPNNNHIRRIKKSVNMKSKQIEDLPDNISINSPNSQEKIPLQNKLNKQIKNVYAKSSAMKLDDVQKNITQSKGLSKNSKKSASLKKAHKNYIRAYNNHKRQMQTIFRQMSKEYILKK